MRIVILTILFATLSLGKVAFALDKVDPQGVLAISKIVGACGVLDSLIQFQSATKLAGGDEFVVRFWQTEAARLGYSVDQLSKNCSSSIAAYDRVWNSMEQKQ